MMTNEYTVTLKLKRGQVCRLLVLLAARLSYETANGKIETSWSRLHDTIKEQLDKFDAETAKRKESSK